jgi:hypothetical protein
MENYLGKNSCVDNGVTTAQSGCRKSINQFASPQGIKPLQKMEK